MKQLIIFFSFIFPLILNGQDKFFYKEEELMLNDSSGLCGTLTTSRTKDSINLLTILVGGSGPTDRNGNQFGVMFPNTCKFLAHTLAQNGITSFRFDKRGVGASAFSGVTESKITFDTYIQDLCDWIKYFRLHHKYRKIVLIGHSEGALIAFIAGKRSQVDGYVSLSSPGSTVDSILENQIKERMPSTSGRAIDILNKLRSGKTVDTVPSEFSVIFRKSVQPFLISMMAYNPCVEIAGIVAPILIIQGDNDLQVKLLEAEKLARAKVDAKLVIIPGMNHVLKICGKDLSDNLKSYNSPTIPISGTVISEILKFFSSNRLL